MVEGWLNSLYGRRVTQPQTGAALDLSNGLTVTSTCALVSLCTIRVLCSVPLLASVPSECLCSVPLLASVPSECCALCPSAAWSPSTACWTIAHSHLWGGRPRSGATAWRSNSLQAQNLWLAPTTWVSMSTQSSVLQMPLVQCKRVRNKFALPVPRRGCLYAIETNKRSNTTNTTPAPCPLATSWTQAHNSPQHPAQSCCLTCLLSGHTMLLRAWGSITWQAVPKLWRLFFWCHALVCVFHARSVQCVCVWGSDLCLCFCPHPLTPNSLFSCVIFW